MGNAGYLREIRGFGSEWELAEFRKVLSEAVLRGEIEQIQVFGPNPYRLWEEWYKDKRTGEIYSLFPPEERIKGHWKKMDLGDLIQSNGTVQ